jgi:prolipoprotein diacylglyceryltransferase
VAIAWYARKHSISVRHFADSIAPALMIAYAIGRVGCQVAGDGDWGVYNSAYKLDANNEVILADSIDFENTVKANTAYFSRDMAEFGRVEHRRFPQPAALGFLPTWLFAYQYPHNVNEAGVPIAGCEDRYCRQLPSPVFPTPFYELIACSLLFLLLWSIRKKIAVPGSLFCLYLILNGLERFFIEKIRVNNRLNFLGMHPSQAEIISSILILTGVIGWFLLRHKYRTTPRKV